MFNLLKKKNPLTKQNIVLPITLDIHSHILPGIDDGAPDIGTSLKLIKGLNELGIQKSIATPHIIGDLYRNTPETINEALEKVKVACRKEGIGMEILAAAEYMLDDHFMGLLKQGKPLLTLIENIILTELPYTMPPNNLEEMTFAILTGGYQPILAHPERYFYYHDNYVMYDRLHDLGFQLQVNLLSLTGYYGKNVVRAARYILKKGLASLVGTDLHHERHLAALQDTKNLALFNELLVGKRINDFKM